ncbi:hypothetical protein SSX86_016395 [Deinandra increscens subsp. villosa]|uniref:F-box domain-containing protein n=1 Tax=Deinandra increscens subsp. villosa TaxID=3103831 RepID=A0AAP0D379_9ASTR
MPTKLKSNRRRSKRFRFVPKPKQELRVKQPTRNWLELPSDLMVNILQRVGVIEVLENAQKVCTAWREICKDPAMWRVIHMQKFPGPRESPTAYQKMCKLAVDRSQGQVVDLKIIGFCDEELLEYVVDRSSQLKRLEILCCWGDMYGIWAEAFKKLPLLEELSLGEISPEDIEAAGRYCPSLKKLKVNQEVNELWVGNDGEESILIQNEMALVIGKNLPQLTHLELIENSMSNLGLQAILDGCCHLESLDLRRCFYLDLKGDLGKRCSQQIKDLKLPHDPHEEHPHTCEMCDLFDDSDDEYPYDEYDGYSDYDDYTAYDNDGSPDLENLSDMLAFMAMFG